MSRILLKYELQVLLRDSRTLFLSVVLPIILLPGLLFSLNKLGQQSQGNVHETYRYARIGLAPVLYHSSDQTFDGEIFQELQVDDPKEHLRSGELDMVLEMSPPEDEDSTLVEELLALYPDLHDLIDSERPGVPKVEIYYRADREQSAWASMKAERYLKELREEIVSRTLEARGAPPRLTFEVKDVSTLKDREARRYGPALAAFLVLVLLGGGSVAALDSLAGERERGTLETLFVSSLDRQTIAWSKFGAVLVVSLAIAILQIINLGIYVAFGFVDWPFQTDLMSFLALGLLFVAEAIFVASLLLYISTRSTSFKEAQLFFFPTFLVAFALSLAGLMPALVGRSIVSLVPVAGAGVAVPELLAGRIDLPVLATVIVVHLLSGYLLLRSTVHHMESEGFLDGGGSGSAEEFGFGQFSRRVLPFFALLAALLFVVPSNFEFLSSLTGQTLFNQLILLCLLPYLLLRYFGLEVKQVVPIRPVDPRIIVVSLLLVPLGLVAATGVTNLVGAFLPTPVELLEEMMSEMLGVSTTAPWLLFLQIGLLPGLCEEFAFRGVLLNGLHRRFGPWVLAFVVALVFGFFHLNLFRLVPTAYLGFFMTLLTLATGSIIPSIIVHVGNNSLAVWLMLNGWDLDGVPHGVYLAAFVGQLLAIWLIFNWGKGYPGTDWWKQSRDPLEDS